MKLVTIDQSGVFHLGVKQENFVFDITEALKSFPEENLPTDIMSVIGNSEAFLPQIERFIARVTGRFFRGKCLPFG